MTRLPLRTLAALMLGASPLTLSGAFAQEQAHCGTTERPCGPFHDDSSTPRRGVAPNLERGAPAPTSASTDDAFRVTVDGESDTPADADLQRAADKELAQSGILVQVTRLDAVPMLSVAPAVPNIRPGAALKVETLTNYAAFIDRAELRIFGPGDSPEGPPLTVVPVRLGEPTLWTVPEEAGERSYRILLRVYDKAGLFDETAPAEVRATAAHPDRHDDARSGPSFENMRLRANIPVKGTEVTVSGGVTDASAEVSAFGTRIPVDPARRFVGQQIVPAGTKEIVVRVAEPGGPAKDYRRALNAPNEDHFLVAIADLTAGHRSFDRNRQILQGEDQGDTRKDFVDGRLAFYYRGRLSEDWRLTASADTGEHPVSDLFDGFLKRDPRSLLRRLDPERHYPVYGDDSTTIEDAPTYGRFYVRAESETTEAMWGNFQTQLAGNELIRYQRGLYGAQAKWRNPDVTGFGERRTDVTGFAADPGTIGAREDFTSTGGSVYYLRNRDLAAGSERLFVEVRDKDSGLVLERRELIAARDYEVNYIQGRVMLREALPLTADNSLFVQNASLAGNPVWLVATYEYVPGLTRPDAMTVGGRAQHWLTDNIRVGVTGYHQGEDQASQDLYGTDILLRLQPGTWLKGEFAHSKGPGTGASWSSTGGYDFTQIATTDTSANAFNVEGVADLAEVFGGDGQVAAYWKRREAGYSGPGELTFSEGLDQFGGKADVKLTDNLRLQAKADLTQGDITSRHAIEGGLRYEPVKGWFGSAGLRSDKQQGQASAYSPFPSSPDLTGTRTDLAVSAGYRHAPEIAAPEQGTPMLKDRPWSASVFGQKTLDRSGGRQRNDRYGVQGDMQVSDRFGVRGALSDGDLGFGADARATFNRGERGSLYLGYALAAENPDSFNSGRLGRLTAGARERLSSSTSVFAEGRYEHGSGPTGLTQAYGVDFTPLPGWTFGARYERGALADALGNSIRREVVGGTVDYGNEELRWATAVEYRRDDSDSLGDRHTYATRNQITFRATDALRLFGRANVSVSQGDKSGTSLDADFYEFVVAGAYRPVDNDRLNVLAKYTFLYDLPSPAQVDSLGLNLDYAQRSHIVAVDGTYQLTPRLAVGAKVAYRRGELRASRDESAQWFASEATFWALRADYRVIARWDVLAEVRRLAVKEAEDARLGALVGVYRHLGNNLKIGVGYNFTDYSDDLSDLSYDDGGVFVNIIGKF